MNWIKDNKFLVGLGSGTLVGVILLFVLGSKGRDRYEQAKNDFDAAYGEASGFERIPLYPETANKDGKNKSLADYRKAAEDLQAEFAPFRPKELKNVSPQEFTNHLKAVDKEVRTAFEDAGTAVPEPFFCGFEDYKTSLARASATGILDYQLASVRTLMLALAESGATELKNIYRPKLTEEQGGKFQAQGVEVARQLPLEITFSGPENSVRSFLSSISKLDEQFIVIRSLRITNEKSDPPRAADAKFDTPAPVKAPALDDIFGGAFVLPGEETEEAAPAGDEAAAPAFEEPVPAPAPPPVSSDSSRILSQVLGNEEVQVFLRLDLMQFLPAKKLP